ncbi:hypothetical protein TNCV_4806341 [Trichonephila clavipes]|nr:hypothetical protein TNCV_4806341 [Trichonephila clavipes]
MRGIKEREERHREKKKLQRCAQKHPLVNFKQRRYIGIFIIYASVAAPGRESLAVNVTDSLLECHEFEHSTIEDLPCRGGRCPLNKSMFKRPPVGTVWKLGEGVPA